MIRAIFFDFDGTISDARKLVSDGMFWLLEKEEYVFDKIKLNYLIGDKLEKIIKELHLEGDVNYLRKKFYDRIVGQVDNTKLKLVAPIKPLRELSKKYPLFVISNAESRFTKKCAKKLGVYDLFKEIHGAEGFKTKDEFMEKLFRKYKLKPHEVIYVGDRFSDIEYARKAGCWAVAIHNKYSWSTKKVILSEHPDFIIKDFEGLKKVVKKLDERN